MAYNISMKTIAFNRDATGIPETRNSDRILGIQYNPESDEKLNPEHRHIMCYYYYYYCT